MASVGRKRVHNRVGIVEKFGAQLRFANAVDGESRAELREEICVVDMKPALWSGRIWVAEKSEARASAL